MSRPTNAEILAVLKAQHDAIDRLMTRAIQDNQVPRFMPSRSGPIWDAVLAGNELEKRMLEAEEQAADAPMIEVPMIQLCYTDRTLYGIDKHGRVWFINLQSGGWERQQNPIEKHGSVEKIYQRDPMMRDDVEAEK